METKEEKIYHYTDYNALFGILNNKELWLGNIAGMNDKSEIVDYINNLEFNLHRSILSLYTSNPQEQRKIFYRYTSLSNKLSTFKGELNPFSLCFSKNEDDAAMWERYGNNAQGVCLEFDRRWLEKLFVNSEFKIIDESYNLDIEPFIFELAKDYLFKEENNEAEKIYTQILLQSCSHKHIGFNSENEVRLVTLYPDILITDYEEINYVTNAERIRKVLVLRLQDYCAYNNLSYSDIIENLISKIIIGPRSKQNLSDLKSFLLVLGLDKLAYQIYESSCPLR